MTRRPSPEALNEAAQIARDRGVTVRLQRGPDGWVYEISPAVQPASTASEKDKAACDEAFGL